jgi:hypothetical protein
VMAALRIKRDASVNSTGCRRSAVCLLDLAESSQRDQC